MGKYWSVDAVQKDVSTSLYGTIISLSESPKNENLIYAGTDDGLIQVTEALILASRAIFTQYLGLFFQNQMNSSSL